MGELMQTSDAFNGVRVSLSWFILNYPTLTEWKATVDRLTQFNSILQEKESESSFTRESTNDGSIELKDIHLFLPDGSSVAEKLTLRLNAGEKTALTGPSGIGKVPSFIQSGVCGLSEKEPSGSPQERCFSCHKFPICPSAHCRISSPIPK